MLIRRATRGACQFLKERAAAGRGQLDATRIERVIARSEDRLQQ